MAGSTVPASPGTDRHPAVARYFPDLAELSSHGVRYVNQHAGRYTVDLANSGRIEFLLESVRRECFPSVPSRFRSYFGTPTLTAARAFLAGYGVRPDWNPQVVRIEGVYWGPFDMRLLNAVPAGLADQVHCAAQYWSGHMTPDPLPEVMIEPGAYVVGVEVA